MPTTPKTRPESIRFECDALDKRLAREIALRNGGSTMSATLRRLIREEARRLGIYFVQPTQMPAAGQEQGR